MLRKSYIMRFQKLGHSVNIAPVIVQISHLIRPNLPNFLKRSLDFPNMLLKNALFVLCF